MNRMMPGLCLSILLGFCGVISASATDSFYINNAVVSYPGTLNNPPDIDATNFVNNGSFTIDFQLAVVGQYLYEPNNTLNYTNTGVMDCNTGFQFDNRVGGGSAHEMAANFVNTGSISNQPASDPYSFIGAASGLGGFDVWATNIINPGYVDVGVDGFMVFQGQNLDLSRSALNMEGFGADGANIGSTSGTGSAGTNIWDPAFLGSTFAESGFFPVPPGVLYLPNSTAYIHEDSNNGGSNIVYRAVFIEDFSPTPIPYKIYFDTAGIVGGGNVTIEWDGAYLDPVTGNYHTNYLYMNNDYLLGASTNVSLIGGYPDNLTFIQSATPINLGVAPAASGFSPVFPAGEITNLYSFGNVQILSTSSGTNAIPNRSITNLTGRIEILASNELNLSYAQITGPSYLSIQSPNQFDGNQSALIQSPYSDLNLGVTNGFLTMSNLLASEVPNWNGTVQAWDTRWFASVNGVSNDFRVLIVGSDLSATTLAQIQNLFLHATNSIVLSDALNIMSVASGDAQNLTLTTNGPGVGAESVDGELNVETPNVFWASSFPNLVNLTNYGAIRLQNFNQFIATSNSFVVTPPSPATYATGTLSELIGPGQTNVAAGDAVTLGFNTYTFATQLNNTVLDQVKIATTFNGSLSNLIAAINLTTGSGTIYSTNTTANPLATAGLLASNAFTVASRAIGPNGNSVPISTTSANLSWNGNSTLAGGANALAGSTNTISSQIAYQNFINNGLLSDQGSTVWANNFVSDGTISNGLGSFTLSSLTTTLTNGFLQAGGDIAISADSLVTSNLMVQAGRSVTLQVTNYLTDSVYYGPGIVTNGSSWVLGGSSSSVGLNLLVKPAIGDLLGTTITNIAPFNRHVINTWAGQDLGASAAGFTNNAAVGRLILDASTNSVFTFVGAGVSNAIYVDYLELLDQGTNRDVHGNPIALTNSSNLVIYYAQAVMDGVSVAELLNHENNDHLRWVPSYAGHYSSVALYYAGTTNYVNAALADSPDIDSNGNGIPNRYDPTPFFVSGQVNFASSLTDLPPLSVKLQWQTIPNATNIVQYTTNLLSSSWTIFTNFNYYYYGANVAVPNPGGVNGFISPQPYPGPATNVWIFDALTNAPQRYYRVLVNPNATDLFGL